MTSLPMWVFGYGSLMWNPGFAFTERQQARLAGYRRSFCMWSIHHRGTVQKPGLVLALDLRDGAHCDGVAFAVAPGEEDATMAYLRERELISSAYLEMVHEITLSDGRKVEAVVYVTDENHEQYCAGLPLKRQAEIIASAHGDRGPNREYLANTVAHMRELGISDRDLEWLNANVGEATR